MSINIPAETADESMNPISVEEFERLHPAMLGAIRKAVREELELSHADGRTSECLKIAYNFWVFAEFIRIGDDLRQRCSQRRRNALQLLIIGNGVQFEDPP